MIDNSNLKQLEEDVKNQKVVLFMNGTPMYPKCCSSAMAAQYLDAAKIKYTWYDLTEQISLLDTVRQYTQANVPPFLFVNGEFVACGENLRPLFQKGEIQRNI